MRMEQFPQNKIWDTSNRKTNGCDRAKINKSSHQRGEVKMMEKQGDFGPSSFLKHSCIEVRSLGAPRKSICGLAEGSPCLEGDSVAGARLILTDKSKHAQLNIQTLPTVSKEELCRGLTSGIEQPKCNSRVHATYTRHTSWSARPWTVCNSFFMQQYSQVQDT